MKRLVIFLTFFILFMSSNSIAQIIFGPPTSYFVGGFPASIFASDLDGDGDNDLVTANSDPSESDDISVLINNGDGTFQEVVCYGFGGASLSLSIFASDLDSDGDKDLAVANDGSMNVSILPNNGDGTFQVIGRNYAVGLGPNSVFASDLDGDGDKDLVTANRFVGEARDISVLINNVDGTFHAAVHYGVGGLSQPTSVFASDLDGDGDNDLAVANDISFNVSILPNNGDGTFQVIGRNYDIDKTPYCIFASDLDGDGDKDLATADGYLGGIDGSVSVLINIGPGVFYEAVNYSVGSVLSCPISVFASDLDGDGDKDLATANNLDNTISILENNGDGTFQVAVDWPLGCSPTSICASDLDGDGDNDLAMTTGNLLLNYDVTVLLNQSNPVFGAISGTITNINGSVPLRDARVKVFVIDDFGEYAEFGADTTGTDGQYTVTDLPPGRYSLEVSRNGYYTQTQYGIVPEGGTGTANFSLELAGFIHDGDYVAGDNPQSVYASDLDGDGDEDLAVANYNSNNISVLFNNGYGIFQAPVNYGAGDGPSSIFTADLDGDGDKDLAVSNYSSYNISVLFNNGNGIFQTPVDYAVGSHPRSIFAADLDGDGDIDITVANEYSNNVSILENIGNGTFHSAVDFAVGSSPTSVYASDLDGDGDKDLAVANGYTNNISILENNGNATFQSAVNYGVGTAPMSVFASDFDDDGDMDLAVSNASSNNVSILKNNGNGTFLPAVNYPAGEVPVSVFASDFDGDGFEDLAVTTVGNTVTDSVSVLLNNGDATFQMPVNYEVGVGPCSVFAADLDGDGDKDLATANSSSDNISILLNQSIITGVDNSPEMLLPESFNISQNYPNPFNPTTTINYQIPELSFVEIKIYGVLGNEIETLVNEEKSAGTYEITWNAPNLPSGVYFYKLQTGSFVETKKMVLMK